MSDPETDARLVAFLHDLPEDATKAIQEIISASTQLTTKKASREGWIRLGIYSVMLGGVAVGGVLKFSNVATTSDIRNLEKQYAAVLEVRHTEDEARSFRLQTLEKQCDQAEKCCDKQASRIDLITAPRHP